MRDQSSARSGPWTRQCSSPRWILGLDSDLAQAAEYDTAGEFVTIVTQLWEATATICTAAALLERLALDVRAKGIPVVIENLVGQERQEFLTSVATAAGKAHRSRGAADAAVD